MRLPRCWPPLRRVDGRVRVLTLSRNFGHQAAISAGIDRAIGLAVVVMDGDLQDPPELIPAFLDAWRDGAEVVYAVRRSRRGTPPKRAGVLAVLSPAARGERAGDSA